MPSSVAYFPSPEAPVVATLDIGVCGTNSILGSYHRQFTFKGLTPQSVVVNIRELMPHVDLEAELASAREDLGLTEDQLILGTIERDDRVPALA